MSIFLTPTALIARPFDVRHTREVPHPKLNDLPANNYHPQLIQGSETDNLILTCENGRKLRKLKK